MRRKRTSYRRAKASGNFEEYFCLRRQVKTLVRAAKRNEEMRVALLCKENPKEFFKYVNSRKPISKKIGPLEDTNGNLHFSDEENAVLLNDYFSSVFTVENDQNPPQQGVNENAAVLETVRCTSDEVLRRINKLDRYKSPGSDGFLPRVLGEVKSEVAPHLASIFNASLETGTVSAD